VVAAALEPQVVVQPALQELLGKEILELQEHIPQVVEVAAALEPQEILAEYMEGLAARVFI
jgi:hypothetical protein